MMQMDPVPEYIPYRVQMFEELKRQYDEEIKRTRYYLI